MGIRILIVEDEEKMARMLELELTHEGYSVSKAFDGRTGLEQAESGDFSLVLLDVMLPELSGMEVLRRLRKTSKVPVIMLTARDATMDKVAGLDNGADDYITKPFVIEELLARIRVALRSTGKSQQQEQDLLTWGPLELDRQAHQVRVHGQEVELTHKEFELLCCLLENRGRVLTRDQLMNRVWGYDFMGDSNGVDVYVRFLRGKIDEVFDMKLIHTVRGVGYTIK